MAYDFRAPRRGPKQDEVVNHFKDRVLSGQLAPGARLPTRLALAEQFGVSAVTIQRALDRLRDDGFVVARGRLGTFVADTPPHLNRFGIVFAAHPQAEQNSRASPHAVTACCLTDAWHQAISDFQDPTGKQLVCYEGVDRDLRTEGYQQLLSDVHAQRLAGVLFTAANLSYAPNVFVESQIPCVAIGGPEGRDDMPVLSFDIYGFLEAAVDHLVAQGRTRLAWLALAERIEHRELQAFYEKLIQERDVASRPEWRIGLDPSFERWAKNATRLMMNLPPAQRPDGLIVADDHFVPAVAQALQELNIDVPEMLDVVALCNHTNTSPTPSYFGHLGPNIPSVLNTALQLLESQQRGEPVPRVTTIKPIFASAEIA